MGVDVSPLLKYTTPESRQIFYFFSDRRLFIVSDLDTPPKVRTVRFSELAERDETQFHERAPLLEKQVARSRCLRSAKKFSLYVEI